jgi:hypothetical protein
MLVAALAAVASDAVLAASSRNDTASKGSAAWKIHG